MDRKAATDRLAERLTGIWMTAMLRRESDPSNLGYYVKQAIRETETVAGQFADAIAPVKPEPNPTNGQPQPQVKR